jgi:hypothetical protein
MTACGHGWLPRVDLAHLVPRANFLNELPRVFATTPRALSQWPMVVRGTQVELCWVPLGTSAEDAADDIGGIGNGRE